MPWRRDTRPYYILVSELMLQQTQVARVIPKFEEFIGVFPDVQSLADASLADVLKRWQGLGYNRRAKFLHESAKMIVRDYGEDFPIEDKDLLGLPGVGRNTAGAIAAYAFNRPALFVETNVRTVYIHHFFNDAFSVDDRQIIDVLGRTLDKERPREFYWALMDYGAHLKAGGIRNIDQSRHYKKQSPLMGSVRQVRGQIIRTLSDGDRPETALRAAVEADDRYEAAMTGLIKDGLVTIRRGQVYLTK